MMIIKVMLVIFIYLLIGIAVLEIMLWRDRKVDYIKRLIEDPKDDAELITTVVYWPVLVIVLGIYILYFGLKHLIKGTRIFFTAIVYLVAAIIDMEREE